VAGTYKQPGEILSGVYSASISKDGVLSTPRTTPFSAEVSGQVKEELGRKIKEKDLHLFQRIETKAFELENGSIELLSVFSEKLHSDIMGHYLLTGNILLTHFENSTANFSFIPKVSTSYWGLMDEYKVIQDKNNLYVFYNENEQNITNNGPNNKIKTFVFEKFLLSVTTINNGKIINREKVTSLHDENFYAILSFAEVLKPKTLIIPFKKLDSRGDHNGKFRLVTIEVK
jgi:hypothetical protein